MWSDQSRSMGSVIWGSTVIGVALLHREKEVFLKIKQNKWQWVVTTLYQGNDHL